MVAKFDTTPTMYPLTVAESSRILAEPGRVSSTDVHTAPSPCSLTFRNTSGESCLLLLKRFAFKLILAMICANNRSQLESRWSGDRYTYVDLSGHRALTRLHVYVHDRLQHSQNSFIPHKLLRFDVDLHCTASWA